MNKNWNLFDNSFHLRSYLYKIINTSNIKEKMFTQLNNITPTSR